MLKKKIILQQSHNHCTKDIKAIDHLAMRCSKESSLIPLPLPTMFQWRWLESITARPSSAGMKIFLFLLGVAKHLEHCATSVTQLFILMSPVQKQMLHCSLHDCLSLSLCVCKCLCLRGDVETGPTCLTVLHSISKQSSEG